MQEQTQSKNHSLFLENRAKLSLTGVFDVLGFDEQTVNAKTSMGTLIVKGDNLHINKLNLETGEVDIDGEIYAMQYILTKDSKSLMSRIFK